jgi:hypothetical protein
MKLKCVLSLKSGVIMKTREERREREKVLFLHNQMKKEVKCIRERELCKVLTFT